MNLKITRNGQPLPFIDTLPPELRYYKVFHKIHSSVGAWGAAIFQVIDTDDFSIWYSYYNINEPSTFTFISDLEPILLHVACKNQLDFVTSQFGRVQTKESQFNITYFPKVNMTGHFLVGEYISFAIIYSKKYLNRFVPHLPALEQFLINSENKIASRLSLIHAFAPHEMRTVINSMLKYEYGSNMDNIYLECKTMELLTLAIQKLSKNDTGRFKLNKVDVDRMVQVKDWLTANIDDPGSLQQIARQFGINEHKLKRDFKAIYGMAVFEYLLDLRMERAKKMLRETNTSITDIAYLTGYSRGSHFTDAFRKHFNFPPTYFRRKG